MNAKKLITVLKKEVTPALGCTEPVAIALAAAKAKDLVGGQVQELKLVISSNIFKNAKAVGIPCTEQTGVEFAAILGAIIAEPPLDLTIFSGLTEEITKKAQKQLVLTPPEIEVQDDLPGVYIDAKLKTDAGTSRVIIAEQHTNFIFLEKDGKILLDKRTPLPKKGPEKFALRAYPLETVIRSALTIPPKDLAFLLDGVHMNMAMADVGLKIEQGLRFGQRWKRLQERGLVSDDLSSKIALYTAAACDARMAGIKLPIMSSAGSGNHGLVAIIPVATAAEQLKSETDRLVQALALSHLITLYIKEFTGRLSPICGCAVAAGSGAGAAITYLLGGDIQAIENAITNVISNLAGMICDGGKVGCALKLCTSAVTAWWSALLACEGLAVPAGNGIVGATLYDTITNLGNLTKQGMQKVDKSVTSILESIQG